MNDEDALQALKDWMRRHEKIAIAYSGGTESTLLVAVAKEAIPDDFEAVMVDLPYLSERQRLDALATAEAMGIKPIVISTKGIDFDAVKRNDRGRCYHCKAIIYDAITEVMKEKGLRHIVDGENVADEKDLRPGRVAAREREVLSPLAELGIDRETVERLVKRLGLPVRLVKETCLATRLEEGIPLNRDILENIERAESFLYDAGFEQVRVRVHGPDARIEVMPEDLPHAAEMGRKIHTRLRELGFRHISLDLKGYRTGSMWE